MILAILQARVSSTRLPEKVMKPILGVPMLLRQMERLNRVNTMNQFVVATSQSERDNAIGKLCQKNRIDCYRGDLDDVLDRFYQAAKEFNPTHVVRLTGDCPLTDPDVIERVIDFHISGDFDYTSNTMEPTFPDGLDVEVFRMECLEQAWKEAKLPSQREHVTPFMYANPERYKLGSYKGDTDLSQLRWTVDEPEDLEFVTKIYEYLYPQNAEFSTGDVLELLRKYPHLLQINHTFERNEGYRKSLEQD